MGMAAAVADLRKHENIERLLHWTYRDELPKGYERSGEGRANSVSPMFRLCDLGTVIDSWSREPGFPIAMGQPHQDALQIHAAVERLPDVGLDWAQSRARLMHDLVEWTEPNDPVLSNMTFQPSALVMLHARMGTRPIWDLGMPKVVRRLGKNWKPVVQYLDETGYLVEGRTNGRHYGPMARCPLDLVPNAREVACARAEYMVWHQALEVVTKTICAWGLHDHHALSCTAAAEPWIVDNEPKPRILKSLRVLRTVS